MKAPLYVVPPPTLRLVKRDLVARAAVVDYLRQIARQVEEGDIAADAVLIVTSWGDVHDVHWNDGYHAWPILSAAATSAHDAYWAAMQGREYDPDAAAAMRLRNRQYRAEETARKLAGKPFPCVCGDRFKTERGRDAHIKRPGRWFSTKGHAPAQDPEPARLRLVVEDGEGDC